VSAPTSTPVVQSSRRQRQRLLCSTIEDQPQRVRNVPRFLLRQLREDCEDQRRSILRRFRRRVPQSLINSLLRERSVTFFL
jgi:hypothetical protein